MNLKLENISKLYGNTLALSDINLQFTQGNIYCILGINGAGKTTLLNIISGLLTPSNGEILYDGTPYRPMPDKVKFKIGVLSESNPLIEELTPKQYLSFVGKLYGLKKHIIQQRIEDLLNYFFEETPPEKSLATYSTGMKKKIGLCAAVIHAPDVILLDEPFTSLDPLSAELTVRFISDYQNNNRLILISSHEINLVEKIASQIIVIDKGNLIFNNTLNHFVQDKNSIDQAVIEMLSSKENAEKSIKKVSWI